MFEGDGERTSVEGYHSYGVLDPPVGHRIKHIRHRQQHTLMALRHHSQLTMVCTMGVETTGGMYLNVHTSAPVSPNCGRKRLASAGVAKAVHACQGEYVSDQGEPHQRKRTRPDKEGGLGLHWGEGATEGFANMTEPHAASGVIIPN
jgi:hypothetical protein